MKQQYSKNGEEQVLDIVTTTTTTDRQQHKSTSRVSYNINGKFLTNTTSTTKANNDHKTINCDANNNNKKELQIIPLSSRVADIIHRAPSILVETHSTSSSPPPPPQPPQPDHQEDLVIEDSSIAINDDDGDGHNELQQVNNDRISSSASNNLLTTVSNSNNNISVNINITIANHNNKTSTNNTTNEFDTTSINRRLQQQPEKSSTAIVPRKEEKITTTGAKKLIKEKEAKAEQQKSKFDLDRVTSMLSSPASSTSSVASLSPSTNDNKTNDPMVIHTKQQQQHHHHQHTDGGQVKKYQTDKEHDLRSVTVTGNQAAQQKDMKFNVLTLDRNKSRATTDFKATKNSILNNMSTSNQLIDNRSSSYNTESSTTTILKNNINFQQQSSNVAHVQLNARSMTTTDINSENQQSNHHHDTNNNTSCDNNNRDGQPRRLQPISQNNNSNNNNNNNKILNNNNSSSNNGNNIITNTNGKCMISNNNNGSCISKQMTNSLSNLVINNSSSGNNNNNNNKSTQPVITHKQSNNNNNNTLVETTQRLMINRNCDSGLKHNQQNSIYLVRNRAHRKRRCRSSNGSSTGEELSDCDLDGPDQLDLNSSNDSSSISDDNEFEYGPGIVDRLRNKFLTISMQQLHNKHRLTSYPSNGSHPHTNGYCATINQQLGQHQQQRQNQRWFSSSVDSLIAAATAAINGVPTHPNPRLASTKSVMSPSANSVRSTPTGTPLLAMARTVGAGCEAAATGTNGTGATKSQDAIVLSSSHSNNSASATIHQQQQQINSSSKLENMPSNNNTKSVQPAKRQPIFKKQQHESSTSTSSKSLYSSTSAGSSTAQGLLLRRQQHQLNNNNAPPSIAQSSCLVPDLKSEELSSKETTNSKDDRQVTSKKNITDSNVVTNDYQQQKIADYGIEDSNITNSSNMSDSGGSLGEENCPSTSNESYQDSDKQQVVSNATMQASQCSESPAPTTCGRNDIETDKVVPSARSTLLLAAKSAPDELHSNVVLHKNIGQQQQQLHNSIAQTKHPEQQKSTRNYNKLSYNYSRFVSATSGSTVAKTIDRMSISDDPSHLSKQQQQLQQQKKRDNPPVLKAISSAVSNITTTTNTATKQIINTNPSIDLNELPKPDIVKTCKRIFEPEQNAKSQGRSARVDITNSSDQHYHQRKVPIATQYLTNNKRLCNDRISDPVPRSTATNANTSSTPYTLTGGNGANSNNRISSCHAQPSQTNLEPEHNSEKSDLITTTSTKSAEKIEKELTSSNTVVDKEEKEEKTNSSESTTMILKIPLLATISDNSTSAALTSVQQPLSSINEFFVHHEEHNASSFLSTSSSSITHSLASITSNATTISNNKSNIETKLEEPNVTTTTTSAPPTLTATTLTDRTTLSDTFQKNQDQNTNNSQTTQLRAIVGKSSLWSAQTTYSPSKSQKILDSSSSSTIKSLSSHLNDINNYSCNGNNNNTDSKTNSFRPQVDGVTTTRTSSGGATTTTIVFDFRGKNVKPNVAVQPRMFGLLSPASSGCNQRQSCCMNGGGDNGYDNNNGHEPCHHDDGSIDFPIGDQRHNVTFEGDNVIVGNGSLLIKRNKQLKIKFDDESTITFEYPSEASMSAELLSPTSVSTTDWKALISPSGLSNYKPSALMTVATNGGLDQKLGSKDLNKHNEYLNGSQNVLSTKSIKRPTSNNDLYTNNSGVIYGQSLALDGVTPKSYSHNDSSVDGLKYTKANHNNIYDNPSMDLNGDTNLHDHDKFNKSNNDVNDDIDLRETTNWSNGTYAAPELLF